MKTPIIITLMTISLFVAGCAGTQIKKSENEKCLLEKAEQQQLACNDRVPATDNREPARGR